MSNATVELQRMSIDELARLVARVYAPVSLSDDPTFRWLNILTDVTILGEEIRRGENRRQDAIERVLNVIIRLLDFVGFYLSRPTDQEDKSFANFFAQVLQQQSYVDHFPDADNPPEGPTRWILVKYPHNCAKCAAAPCQCVLTPWIFEERRQKPGAYEKFRNLAEVAREQLKKKTQALFTLPSLLEFFADIYRNTYYNQDHWKTAMHLTEEVGEVTAQLVRVQLLHRVTVEPKLLGKSKAVWGAIATEAHGRLDRVIEDIRDDTKVTLGPEKSSALDKAVTSAMTSATPSKHVAMLAGEKLKEEVADVFSWISAVLFQLSKGEGTKADYLEKFLKERHYLQSVHGEQLEFRCKWCAKKGVGTAV